MAKTMKLAIKNDATPNPAFGENDTSSDHFKFRCYYVVPDNYDFAGNSSTEITGAEAAEWIQKLNDRGYPQELSLDDYKTQKMEAIDKRSGELITEGGFVYNGKTFSMSKNAQLNLLGINLKKNNAEILPVIYNTVDNSDKETLNSASDIDAFFMAALAAKKSHLDTGTALKDSVRAATDKAGVDAVIDNR